MFDFPMYDYMPPSLLPEYKKPNLITGEGRARCRPFGRNKQKSTPRAHWKRKKKTKKRSRALNRR